MIQFSDRQRMLLIRYGQPVLIGLLVLLNGFALWNFGLLTKDLIYGDKSADELLIRPLYHPIRVPVREITKARDAVGRVGSDFAQVYFPGLDVAHMQDGFDTSRTLDPWRRPSRYAPFVELACAATLCNFNFGLACFLHIVFQLLLLYAVLYWMFREFGIQQYVLPCLLFVNVCLFLTPVGLAWFERGQFTLYLSASYPLLIIGLLKKKWPLVAAAAVLAFIKWTSFPAVFVILVVYLLSSRSLREFKSNLALAAVFGGVVIALLVVPALFTQGTEAFVRGLLTQEMEDLPKGASLLRYLPRLAVKLLPLAVIALGYLSARGRKLSDWLVPYAAGAVIIMLVYPTRAYEYGLPSVLGFIPLLMAWALQPGEADVRMIRQVLLYVFLLFIGLASLSTRLFSSLFSLVQFYVVVALVFMLAPAVLALAQRSKAEASLGVEQA